MKLKSKLIISFCIIIFVPLLLACGVILGFKNVQIKELQQNYGIENYDYMTNSIQLLSRFTNEDYENLLTMAQSDPKQLMDEEYLCEENKKLQEKCSYLMVRFQNTILFCGEEQKEQLLEDVLPEYGDGDMSSDSGMYVDGEVQSLIKQIGRAHV